MLELRFYFASVKVCEARVASWEKVSVGVKCLA